MRSVIEAAVMIECCRLSRWAAKGGWAGLRKPWANARATTFSMPSSQSGEQVIATRLGTLPEGGEPWELVDLLG